MAGMDTGIALNYSWWELAVSLLLVIFSFYIYKKTVPAVSGPKRFLMALIRSAAFIALLVFIINPVLKGFSSRVRRPVVPVLLDISESMSIKDCGGISRIEAATLILDSLKAGFRDGERAVMPVFPFGPYPFKEPVERDSIEIIREGGTDISAALKYVSSRYRYGNIDGLILLSDGVNTGIKPGIETFGVPVFSIGFGDTAEAGYIGIEDIIYQERIYAGTKARISVLVSASGHKGTRSADLVMLENGRPVDRTQVDFEEKRGEYRAVFDFKPERPGTRRMRVSIEGPEISSSGRKKVDFNLKVIKERKRILFIDERADWNMAFLRDLDASLRGFEIDCVTKIKEKGHIAVPSYQPWEYSSFRELLGNYEMVVISDCEEIFTDRDNAEALVDFVLGGGGTLFLADQASPLIDSVGYGFLQEIIPVKRVSEPGILNGDYFLRIDGERNNPLAVIISELNGVEDVPPLPAILDGFKPTLDSEVAAELYDSGKGTIPLAAVAVYGEGASGVIFGLNIWRWRLADSSGEELYDRMFGALIRYISSGGETDFITVFTSRNTYSQGERPLISVRVRGKRVTGEITGRLYRILKNGKELEESFVLEKQPGESGLFKKRISPVSPGNYRAVATEIKDSGKGLSGRAEFTVDSLSVEFLDRSMDHEFLKGVAGTTFGEFFDWKMYRGLMSVLDPSPDQVKKLESSSARSNALFFFFIVSLFTLEWFLRKLWGLV